MPRKITDRCVGCGTCSETCPMGAIHPESDVFEINPDECVDCGACEGACPVGAIEEE